jgi:hypothetical protein
MYDEPIPFIAYVACMGVGCIIGAYFGMMFWRWHHKAVNGWDAE